MLWWKGGSPWPFGGTRANLSGQGAKLRIKRLKLSDSDAYKCRGCKDCLEGVKNPNHRKSPVRGGGGGRGGWGSTFSLNIFVKSCPQKVGVE